MTCYTRYYERSYPQVLSLGIVSAGYGSHRYGLSIEKDQFKIVKYKRRAYAYVDFSCGNASMDRWLKENAGQADLDSTGKINPALARLFRQTDADPRIIQGLSE